MVWLQVNATCAIRKRCLVDLFDISMVETGNAKRKKETVCSNQMSIESVFSSMADGSA